MSFEYSIEPSGWLARRNTISKGCNMGEAEVTIVEWFVRCNIVMYLHILYAADDGDLGEVCIQCL